MINQLVFKILHCYEKTWAESYFMWNIFFVQKNLDNFITGTVHDLYVHM